MSTSRLPAIGTLIGLIVLAAGCGSPAATSTASGSLSSGTGSAALPSTRKSAFDLAVGDCFDSEDLSRVTDITVVDCDASHAYEVFGVSAVPGDPSATFPGNDALTATADRACRAAFRAYVGVDFNASEWYGTFLNPSESTWATGDREIVCVLHTQATTPVTGSAKGSAK
jgi:hypothetical protein